MIRDMSNPSDIKEYDILIDDGARDLAIKYRGDIVGMRKALLALGIPALSIIKVLEAQQSPEYEEIKYRGGMCDEGVIESLKDCLRPIYGF